MAHPSVLSAAGPRQNFGTLFAQPSPGSQSRRRSTRKSRRTADFEFESRYHRRQARYFFLAFLAAFFLAGLDFFLALGFALVLFFLPKAEPQLFEYFSVEPLRRIVICFSVQVIKRGVVG